MSRPQRLVRFLLAATLLLFASLQLNAQTSRAGQATLEPKGPQGAVPAGGYLGIILDYPPLAPLGQAGVDLQFGANEVYSNGQFIFNVDGGLLDLKTGNGELATEGGFIFGNDQHHFAFRRLMLESTFTGYRITGMLFADGVAFGRWPLFLLATNPVGRKLQTGQLVAPRTDMTLSLETAFLLNGAFGTHYTHKDVIGGVTLNLLLRQDGGPQ